MKVLICSIESKIQKMQFKFKYSNTIQALISSNIKRVVTYLFEAKSLLVHVTEIKHGLCIVLLFRCESVMQSRNLIINFSAKPIEMVISYFHSRNSVAFNERKNQRLSQRQSFCSSNALAAFVEKDPLFI